MKKLIAISFAVVAFAASAQDTVSTEGLKQNFDKFKSKRGVVIFPEKGEWALGVSANPFLNYLGNAFSGATASNQAPTVQSPNPSRSGNLAGLSGLGGAAVFLKYMKTESTAYRMRVAFDLSSVKSSGVVVLTPSGQQGPYPSQGEDAVTTGNTAVMIGLGIEKRRGKDRIKGIYGAEGLIGFSTQKSNYTYANAIETVQPINNNTYGRTQSVFLGNRMFIGARAFVGVEYFFAPKISIGGEIGYTAGVSFNGRGNTVEENINPNTAVAEEITRKTSGYVGYVGLSSDAVNATINLHFYF